MALTPNYWTAKLAQKLEPQGITFPPYTAHFKNQSGLVVIALSGIKNNQLSIQLARHIPLDDLAQPVLAFASAVSQDGLPCEAVYEYVNIAPHDRAYLQQIGFHEDPVEVTIKGEAARAQLTARHLRSLEESTDLLARAILYWNQQDRFKPLSGHELTPQWNNLTAQKKPGK